jgi:putative SOS response-associated peptidase YedK
MAEYCDLFGIARRSASGRFCSAPAPNLESDLKWKKITVKEKQPYAIGMTDGMMIMAGLWSKWKDPKSGDEFLSCTILTCLANDVMAELHDRMPVILTENDWARWLGEQPASEDELLALLKPCQDDALRIWPVGKAVGNVKNVGRRAIASAD